MPFRFPMNHGPATPGAAFDRRYREQQIAESRRSAREAQRARFDEARSERGSVPATPVGDVCPI